jgi:hypothetical protein
MAAFDEQWWDLRTVHFGKYDTGGLVDDGGNYVLWVRWRLIDELLRRYYTDFGLEPAFGLFGTELKDVALMSPTCRRAPRYFGRLTGMGIKSEDDTILITSPTGLNLTWAKNPGGSDSEGPWESWSEYRQHAIRTLGLATAGVTGHQGCFHRRGKTLTPLMYRVALLLRTNGGYDLMFLDDAMLTVGSWMSLQHNDAFASISRVIADCGGSIPPGPPRYIGVEHEIYKWIALRTDGWIATPAGPVDAAGLWRAGANEEEIASAVYTINM